MASTPALEVSDLVVRRGLLSVVQGVSLSLEESEVRSVVGLNGAGKTSLLLALAGAIPTHAGSVRVAGVDVTGKPSWVCCRQGLVCVPAGRQLFAGLSVLDNLLIGSHLRSDRKDQGARLQKVFEYFPILADKRRQRADELSGGQQQMLAIGRGIMADPAVLLLDEPSEGLAPLIVTQVFEAIRQLAKSTSIAVLLAEQNASVLEVCDTTMLMRNGELSAPRQVDSASESELAVYMFEVSS